MKQKKILKQYSFKYDQIKQDINNLIYQMKHQSTLSSHASFSPPVMDHNFQTMLHNFKRIMLKTNTDINWIISDPNKSPIFIHQEIQNLQVIIQRLLINGIVNNIPNNLIFEFHRINNFDSLTEEIYKLLLNAIVTRKTTNLQPYTSQILSQCLINAALCNSTSAIEILINNYDASVTIPFRATDVEQSDYIVPLLQILQTTSQNFKILNDQTQLQQNLIFIVKNNSFHSNLLSNSDIKKIFCIVLKNEFNALLQELLSIDEFYNKLCFYKIDLMRISVYHHINPVKYFFLINFITSHKHLINIDQKQQRFELPEPFNYLYFYIEFLQEKAKSQFYPSFKLVKLITEFPEISCDFVNYLQNNYTPYQNILAIKNDLEKIKFILNVKQIESQKYKGIITQLNHTVNIQAKIISQLECENTQLNQATARLSPTNSNKNRRRLSL